MLICAGPALVFCTVPVYQIDITFKNGIATPGQVCVIENVQLKKKTPLGQFWRHTCSLCSLSSATSSGCIILMKYLKLMPLQCYVKKGEPAGQQ